VEAWNGERDRVATIAEKCLRLGIEERRVRIVEQTRSAIVDVFTSALEDLELGLTITQQQEARRVIGRHLRRFEATT
jgi:hypothetical protein